MSTILAIDLGKFKSVACIYVISEATHQFRTVPTLPDQKTGKYGFESKSVATNPR